jgi:hypothetical protein
VERDIDGGGGGAAWLLAERVNVYVSLNCIKLNTSNKKVVQKH